MVVLADVIALYEQFDFLPNETIQQFYHHGYILGSVVEWLLIPEPVARALYAVLGADGTSHISTIAHTTIG